MYKKDIENEIAELKKVKSVWNNTTLNKKQAKGLTNQIKIFNHTFSAKFPNSVKYYRRNGFAEIHITDAISELRGYSKSILKNQDDNYFYDGMKNLNWGIDDLISNLQTVIEEK